jgi:CHAT domain-containing protein
MAASGLLSAAALSLSLLLPQADLFGARLKQGYDALDAGRTADAEAIFAEVLEKMDPDDRRTRAEARRGQGRVHLARSEFEAMQAAHVEALKLFEAEGDFVGVGRIHSDLGFAAWRRTAWDEASAEYTRAVEAFEKAGARSEQANALRNLTFGRMPIAERRTTLERALQIAREGTDRRLEGLILHALGDTASGLGEQQTALEFYEESLPRLEASVDKAALARLLTSFGRLHRIHGDPEQALTYYARGLELLKTTTDQDAVRQAEDAVGISLAALDRHAEALIHAEAALRIAEASRPGLVAAQRRRVAIMALRAGQIERAQALFERDPDGPAGAIERHMGLAQILAIRGESEAALREADAAVDLAAPLDWQYKLQARRVRSLVHERAGRLEQAAADAVFAVNAVESAREGLVLSDDYRVSFSDGYRGAFDRAVDLLFRTGKTGDALGIAEKGRARALLDLKAARGPAAAEASNPAPTSPEAIALGADEALVSYWVNESAVHAWVTTAGAGTRGFRLAITRKELDGLVTKANAMGARPSTQRGDTKASFEGDPRPTLRLLHDRLIEPLRSTLPKVRGSRLLVIPDGALLGLSFAELLNRNNRYLIEDFTLHYAPSGALLKRRGSGPGARPASPALLVSLSSGFPRVGDLKLDPLPGARREADALARVLSPRETVRLNDAEATETAVRADMERASIIHFATHAVADSRHPAESFIALHRGRSEEGRLTAGEIIDLSLRADLVVLSACHGASGAVAGEGMLGLSRAFLAAGARTLLASVRGLADDAAAEMLPRFYASFGKTGDPASALRAAQLEQLRRLRAGLVKVETPFGPLALPEHPSLWAGLVVIGER